MGAPLGDLVHGDHRKTLGREGRSRAAGGDELVAHLVEHACHSNGLRLVAGLHTDEGKAALARVGQLCARSNLRLHKGLDKTGGHAHDLAGRFHLRAQDGVHTRELHKGKDRLLDREIRRHHLGRDALVVQALAQHGPGRHLGQGHARGLRDKGHRARCPWVDLQHIDPLVLNGELHIHEAHHIQGLGHELGLALELGNQGLRERIRWQAAGGVARVHACLLDVLHDPANHHALAIGEGVHIDLNGVVEKAVE